MPVPVLRRGAIVRIRDERWSVCGHVPYASAVIVDVRGCDPANRGRRARFLLPFEPLQQLPASAAIRVVSRRRWRHLARPALACATPACDSLRTLTFARIDLLPFQLEPALAVVRGAAARILLADEVGLGKTVQAALIASEILARIAGGRVLVVCPAALRTQWARELESRFGLQSALLDSAALAGPESRASRANPWSAHPLIVASIDYVKRPEVLRALEDLVWDAVVIDEAHGAAGRSDRHAAACLLGDRARTLVMLTATPHSGDDEAFRRLCTIGDISRQFPLAVFRRTRADVGWSSSRRTTWLAVTPGPAETEMHRALMEYARRVWQHRGQSADRARLAMVVLLKRACSSAASLARSVERRLQLLADPGGDLFQLALPFGGTGIDDDEPASELSAPGLANPQIERGLLENILRLAHAAERVESKRRVIRRLLRRSAERAIVFTEYRDTLASLAAELAPFGCAELHGGLAPGERDQVLREFVTGSTRVLLATDAASEGLNLHQRCRLVVNLEVPWSPLRLEQRIGRVDRIGQRHRVHQLLLVAAGTEEQATIATLVRRRAERASQAMTAMRRPGVEERDIAERAFGGAQVIGTENSGAVDLPPEMIVVDLRARALEEAARASVARALRGNAPEPEVAIRPFAAANTHGSRGCWAFRLCFVDSDDAILWETIVGVWYLLRNSRFHDAAQVREHLRLSGDALVADLRRHEAVFRTHVATVLQMATTLAIAREKAILAQLEHRHARLAASLLQPTLFGPRREERDTAAQRAVVQEALKRCHDRLASLSRPRPAAAMAEPAFAVILR